MRADRLLNIMLMLKARNGMTAKELSQKLEVSQRTIYRDMDALGMAGVPVYTQRGENGGCFLDEQYRLTLQDLNSTELESLFIAGGSDPLQAIGLKKPIEDSRLKLLSTLNQSQQQAIERIQNRIYIDTQNWFQQADDITHLPIVRQAVWTSHKLKMTYERFNGDQRTQTINPYGLVVKANIWYVIGQADHHDTVRIYRISRVQAAEILLDTFTIPDTFDLQQYWHEQQSKFHASFSMLSVRLRITSDMLDTLIMLVKGRLTILDDASSAPILAMPTTIVEVQFHDDNEARAILMSFGNRVFVETPKPLRESIIDFSTSILALYNWDVR